MDQRAEAALAVLQAHGIEPPELGLDMPGIGRLGPNEVAVPVTLDDVFGQGDIPVEEEEDRDIDDRIRGWIKEMRSIIERGEGGEGQARFDHHYLQRVEPPDPTCAWYQPMHFFGRNWGIYIREECILHEAAAVARYVDPAELAAMGLTLGELLQRAYRPEGNHFYRRDGDRSHASLRVRPSEGRRQGITPQTERPAGPDCHVDLGPHCVARP